ncbi:MAG: ribosome silencing factor [Lentisphaeria bacterium]|nr:ribosome silencing factor [Lentisphaeria bacterium]
MTDHAQRMDDEALARGCVKICEEHKALDIKLFDVRGTSMVTDFYLICSGSSEPHIRALSDYIGQGMKEEGLPVLHLDGAPSSRWIVMDFGIILVHLFHPDVRGFYEIEKLIGEEKLILEVNQDDTRV